MGVLQAQIKLYRCLDASNAIVNYMECVRLRKLWRSGACYSVLRMWMRKKKNLNVKWNKEVIKFVWRVAKYHLKHSARHKFSTMPIWHAEYIPTNGFLNIRAPYSHDKIINTQGNVMEKRTATAVSLIACSDLANEAEK